MTFKEQLRVVKEIGLDVLDIQIANEVECIFFEATEPYDFEEVCETIERVYLKTEDISIERLTKTVYKLNEANKDWQHMSKWDIAEEAAWVE